MDPKTLKEFSRWGKTPPEHIPHGNADDVRQNLKRLKPNSWHMEGNQLIGETEMGPLCQFLPTDYICLGTDSEGMPKLKKIEI